MIEDYFNSSCSIIVPIYDTYGRQIGESVVNYDCRIEAIGRIVNIAAGQQQYIESKLYFDAKAIIKQGYKVKIGDKEYQIRKLISKVDFDLNHYEVWIG